MAGRHTSNKLTDRFVRTAPAGTHEDGGGLRLVVAKSGAKRWTLRLTINGKRRNKGLGSYPLVSLQGARDKAWDYRRAAREGRDLAAEMREAKSKTVTFAEAFECFFKNKQQSLSNGKHVAQWRSTMESYVLPHIGTRPVSEISPDEIIQILEPIWHDKPETSARVLQRIEATFKSAIVLGLRVNASPCIGIMDHLGPHDRRPVHHDALAYQDIPTFVQRLRDAGHAQSTSLAFEFLLITAARSGEVRNATWNEINLEKKIWRIPASRMKTRRSRSQSHVVPLPDRALEILDISLEQTGGAGLVFPGIKDGKPLSENTFVKCLRSLDYETATAHGFRSSFKDWCAEKARVRDEVSEAALAHVIANKVRAAYLRTDFLDERRLLMQEWADFVDPEATEKAEKNERVMS